MSQKDRDSVLKNALWIDGTVESQIEYVMKSRSKLMKAYDRLKSKYM